ncbi:hypothetical protein GCK32_009660 [Trichostrongylus colubriformis]|uniref:Uncharacterized protein n=1 Tax=Trichostrongylus colubriformis TaxID=6319 RepID=A0AAN8IF78_TRICO
MISGSYEIYFSFLILENREEEARKSMLFYQHMESIDENGNAKKDEKSAIAETQKSTLALAKERFKEHSM